MRLPRRRRSRREKRRERPEHKKLTRLVEPKLQPYFLCLSLFIAAAILVAGILVAGAISGIPLSMPSIG